MLHRRIYRIFACNTALWRVVLLSCCCPAASSPAAAQAAQPSQAANPAQAATLQPDSDSVNVLVEFVSLQIDPSAKNPLQLRFRLLLPLNFRLWQQHPQSITLKDEKGQQLPASCKLQAQQDNSYLLGIELQALPQTATVQLDTQLELLATRGIKITEPANIGAQRSGKLPGKKHLINYRIWHSKKGAGLNVFDRIEISSKAPIVMDRIILSKDKFDAVIDQFETRKQNDSTIYSFDLLGDIEQCQIRMSYHDDAARLLLPIKQTISITGLQPPAAVSPAAASATP